MLLIDYCKFYWLFNDTSVNPSECVNAFAHKRVRVLSCVYEPACMSVCMSVHACRAVLYPATLRRVACSLQRRVQPIAPRVVARRAVAHHIVPCHGCVSAQAPAHR